MACHTSIVKKNTKNNQRHKNCHDTQTMRASLQMEATHAFTARTFGCSRSWCEVSSDRSFMVNPLSYFPFTKGLTKAMVCDILSVGWCIKCCRGLHAHQTSPTEHLCVCHRVSCLTSSSQPMRMATCPT